MSTRSNLRPTVVLQDDLSASRTSDPTILQSLTVGSYSYSWSGGATPVGDISIEVSNDYSLNQDGTVKNAGTWNAMTVTYNGNQVTTVPLSGNSGNGLIDWSSGAYAIRTVYTRTSGNANIVVMINGKVA